MRKFRPLLIILIFILIVLGLRFAYYTVIKNARGENISLNFEQASVSGIYPHLAVFNENHFSEKPGETGLGAVVPWGKNLYALTYSAHRPKGSSDKLYVIDQEGNMTSHPLSVGGTPANRMIHRESDQLIIGPYFIKKDGSTRVIDPGKMPGRLTATTRHLEDPANKVYFFTMEEGLYEVDVNTLEVNEIYTDGNMMDPPDVAGPLLPGYHGKGAYVTQDRLIVANNGEYRWRSTPESGCLAEWDGKNWLVIDRKQYTEVTGPGGLQGNSSPDDPVWSTGWDEKSLILKVRDHGNWHTYRLPKASFTYDGRHGWHTEWPRIRQVGMDKMLMTMHGMFWAFPADFSSTQVSGIRPYSSYLKIIPDFTSWQGLIVMACDDASSFDNNFVGQPQSNFWFVDKDQLDDFGPRNAYGSLWLNEPVKAFDESDPFLVSGFDQIMITASNPGRDAFKLNIACKKKGGLNWELMSYEMFGPYQSIYRIFEIDPDTEWIRLSTDTGMEEFSVNIHLTQKKYPEPKSEIFSSLAGIGEENLHGGWLRPNGEDKNLSIFYSDVLFTIGEDLEIKKSKSDDRSSSLASNLLPKNESFGSDSASVYYIDSEGIKWRLPWGSGSYNSWYAKQEYRIVREVATERSLLNAGGIFYELPREISGGIKRVKPVSTHNRKIIDFCSWRGMMAITGTRAEASDDGHFYTDENKESGLWLGKIDDLWKFGKPTGTGGPWSDSRVEAGEFSDPYLMLGFDDKELILNHDSNEVLSFEIFADFAGNGDFVSLGEIKVNPQEKKAFRFAKGFSAHWVKLKCNSACKVTSNFLYR